jgi:hypothetical protein
MLAQKLFYASWQLILCIQSAITCHDSNFKFIIFFYFLNIHNWSWIVHKNVRSPMVKTIFELDASSRNYRKKMKEIRMDGCMHACISLRQRVSGAVRWNVQLAERFLCGNELI